uniref:Calponin-homology (CH) domain-containing protein n=1 Tax=Periophthalmus magnuspinnatus TaxID=409849 RepID=A0A3B3Z6Q7_9GOBI
MAGHEWEDWFEREELIGQISDIRVQNLQVERESVQKRTFTRWMNLHLEKVSQILTFSPQTRSTFIYNLKSTALFLL